MKDEMLRTASLFREAETSLAYPYLMAYTYPWEALAHIPEILAAIAATLPRDRYEEIMPGVFVARTATVAPTAFLGAPCIIGEEAEVRHGAFIRSAALVGRGAVVGNSVELKNCILFDGVQVPHFNYVGDSVLGYKAHMGAGAVTSNVKSDKTTVRIRTPEGAVDTGRKKCGAFLADHVEVGCNSVLNPGTVIGHGTRVYPLSSVRGWVPEDSIYKDQNHIIRQI